MYLFFKIEDFYPSEGLRELLFAFKGAEDLKEKICSKDFDAFSLSETEKDKDQLYCRYTEYDYAEIMIWKIESLDDFLNKSFKYDEDECLVYQLRPHSEGAVWYEANPKSYEEVDLLKQKLYDDIVEKLNLV